MPEAVITPAAGAGTGAGAAGSGTGAGTGTGAGSGAAAPAEPVLGWAGDKPTVDTSKPAIDTTSGNEDLADFGEFGEDDTETFDDTAEAGKQSFKEFVESIRAELSSQDPAVVKKAEKNLKRLYGENTLYRETFKTPQEAQQVASKLEAWGGIEGIEKETGEAATLWTMLGAGDPGILDQLEAEYGEGLAKLAPHVDARYKKLDPAGWNHDHAEVFMATLQSAPAGKLSVLSAFNELSRVPGVKDSEAYNRIAEVINGIDSHAKAAPQRSTAQPDEKLKQREQKLAEKENAIYQQGVSAKVLPVMDRIMKAALQAATGGKKLTTEARANLISDLKLAYSAMAKKDADFQKKAKALLSANETDNFIKLVESQMKRTIPLAAKNVWRKYTGISGVSDAAKDQRRKETESLREAGGASAASNSVRTSVPKTAEEVRSIDWARMSLEAKKLGAKDKDDLFMNKRLFYKKGDKNLYSC